MANLVKNWDFSHGRKFQNEVLNKFKSSVHHPFSSPHGSFFLLAVFRRYTFRLTEDSVSMALHSCLGGTPAGFHVIQESDRHFRFSVASKSVGFLVYSLKRIITDHFDIYFHLWRDGGANWVRERKLWFQEEEEKWTRVSYQKRKKHSKRVSFARTLNQSSPTKKSKPSELESVIKIGSFYCPFPSPTKKLIFGVQPSVHGSSIPIDRIFKKLKNDLCISDPGIGPQAGQAWSCDKQGVKTSKQCFKCLTWGHIIRECTNALRCKICFGYNHLAKRCFKRMFIQKQNWVPKSCRMVQQAVQPPQRTQDQQSDLGLSSAAERNGQEREMLPQDQNESSKMKNAGYTIITMQQQGHKKITKTYARRRKDVFFHPPAGPTNAAAAATQPLPNLNDPPVEVQVFTPLDNGVPLQLIPDEVQEDELMDNDGMANMVVDQDLQEAGQQNPIVEQLDVEMGLDNEQKPAELEPLNNYVPLGFVELFEPVADPVMSTFNPSGGLPPDFFRFWAKYFHPSGGSTTTFIPPEWAAFFMAALMNPASYDWAKRFLTSPAWVFFSTPTASSYLFGLPPKCPAQEGVSCLMGSGMQLVTNLEETIDATADTDEDQDLLQATHERGMDMDLDKVSPSSGPWSASLLKQAGKLKITEEDPSLRRSCRMKAQNKGFKGNTCNDRKCIACDSDPPTISPSVIKNLAINLCDVEPEKVSEPALLKKKKTSAPGGKKPVIKKKPTTVLS